MFTLAVQYLDQYFCFTYSYSVSCQLSHQLPTCSVGFCSWEQQAQICPHISYRKFKVCSTSAFSWKEAPTSAFTFKNLLRHYAKRTLAPRSLNVKLGPRHIGHKGRAVWLA